MLAGVSSLDCGPRLLPIEVEAAKRWTCRLRLNRKPGLFRHCSLPSIEGAELHGPDHESGGDMDDVKCAAADDRGMAGVQVIPPG
jgi:hypothetical protein